MAYFRVPPRRTTAIARRPATIAMALSVVLGGCERSRSSPSTDTAPAAAAEPGRPTVGPTTSGWDASAGRLLLIPGPGPDQALVIDPERQGSIDSTPPLEPDVVRGVTATLIGSDGSALTVRLAGTAAPAKDDQCAAPWPVVQLTADTTFTDWKLGLVSQAVRPIPLDSLSGLDASDSAAMAAAAAGVASTLPVKDEAYFRGLPFALHSLHRFSPAPGVQAFAAALVRRVNQEDSPFEERTFVIAEREGDAPWRARYHERSSGTEEEVESAETVAGVVLGAANTASLLLVREVGDGLAYRLLQRDGSRWRARWSSAVGRCRR